MDYLEGHQRRTNLGPLDGLPLFIDDFYVFGFLDHTEIVHVRGRKVSCKPLAKQIVPRISLTVQDVLEERRRNTTIMNVVLVNTKDLKISGNNWSA